MGAYDNIKELAIVCKKNKIWLHVDGAFGGTVIFSKKLKFLLDGISQSDSFCFNAHKTLGAPISSSIFLVKNKKEQEQVDGVWYDVVVVECLVKAEQQQ